MDTNDGEAYRADRGENRRQPAVEFASATAKVSMTKRIRMSEAAQQAKCAKPRANHTWIAAFVATNGRWANLTTDLIRINDSIGELWMLLSIEGVLSEKCRK
jgi:hypothetical protein